MSRYRDSVISLAHTTAEIKEKELCEYEVFDYPKDTMGMGD